MSDRMSKILDAKYSKADLKQLVKNIKSINDLEQNMLLNVLEKHESLFHGTLGKWAGESYKIALKENQKPYHAKLFSVPKAYEDVLKAEVKQLCCIGVLNG